MANIPLQNVRHWLENVVPSILEQYKGAVRWQGCLKAIVEKLQYVDDALVALPSVIDFENQKITGAHLDWLVGLVNVKRLSEESDDDLFARFISTLEKNDAGTPDAVIRSARDLSRTKNIEDVHFMNEAPATFFVYTPKGRQLLKRTTRSIAPAAVNGLPGAAIQFADGSFMGDAEGKIILAVADDENIEPEPGPVPDKIVIGGLPYRVGEMPDGRVWMLENLQLDVPDSWFYDNDESTYGRTGKNYGRLYTWNAAMSIVVPGWHVPSRAEWEQLINSVGGERECKKLTSASFGGTDDFGFNALFGGMRGDDGDFLYVGQEANFISSSETGSRYCDNMCLNESYFYADDYGKTHGCSVRLIQDV